MKLAGALVLLVLMAAPAAAQESLPDPIENPGPTPAQAAFRFPVAIGLSLGVGTVLGRSPQDPRTDRVRRAAVEGSFMVAYRGWRVSPELILREGLAASYFRSVVDLGAKIFITNGPVTPSARVAFVHIHQESLDSALTHLPASLFGVSKEIDHRTGFGAGAAVEFKRSLTKKQRVSRLRPFVALDMYLTWSPGSAQPHGALMISGGSWFGIGKLPADAS